MNSCGLFWMRIMKILFVGDICGGPGRKTVHKVLPQLRKKLEIDAVIANGENAAHGRGLTRKTTQEILNAGVDFLTSGNHVFRIEAFLEDLDDPAFPVIRPANYPDDIVGRGYDLIDLGPKGSILVINLQGSLPVHKNLISCPFRKVDEILDSTIDLKPTATIVDYHAEFTAEKVALGHYVDGRVTALLGTHTHVPTADARVLEKSTAYVTDAGMVGPQNSILWVKKETGIRFQKYPYAVRFEMEEDGPMVFNSVLIEVGENGLADKIERVDRVVNL